MRITEHNIEISTHERRLMKQSVDLEPFAHEEILDVCQMARDAFDEEFADEFEFFDRQRESLGSMHEAFYDVRYAHFDTYRLADFAKRLSEVALGKSKPLLCELEIEA